MVATDDGKEILRIDSSIINHYRELVEKERARRQRRQMKCFNNKKFKLRHKERNFSRYINHIIAKMIVIEAKKYKACIVLEKLKGIKRRTAKIPKS